VNALIASHPKPDVLAKASESGKERFLPYALPQEKVRDQQITYIETNAARIVSALQQRKS